MRASLIVLFTRNWPIKGAAIFLSVMLYVAVQLQQPVTTDFELGLNVQLPPGRTLQQKLPKIRAQISGKGSQVLRLRSLRGDVTRSERSRRTWLPLPEICARILGSFCCSVRPGGSCTFSPSSKSVVTGCCSCTATYSITERKIA